MKYALIQFTSCPNHILTTVTAKTENQQKSFPKKKRNVASNGASKGVKKGKTKTRKKN